MDEARDRERGERRGRLLRVATTPGLEITTELPPPRGMRLPRLVAVLVGFSGLLTLLSAAVTPLRGRVEILTQVIPLSVRASATSIAALAGLGTLVIAGALARRQRRAWWVALVLLVVAGVSHLLKDLDVLEAGVNLGMVVVLVMARREFDAKPSAGSMRRAAFALPGLALVVFTFGWIAILTHRGSMEPHPSLALAALAATRGAVGFPIGLRVTGEDGRWIPGLLPILGVVVVTSAFAIAFRPVVDVLRRNPAQADRVRGLVRRYGSDTLAYFALREDKNYFFYRDVVVPYRYLWNLGLVSGDPIGAPEDLPGAIEAFVRHARSLGWGVAVLAGGPGLAAVYSRLGLRAFYLGDEAIICPQTFSLHGRKIRKVRQACAHVERLGYRLDVMPDTEVSPDLQDALGAITRSWQGRAPERGFTMALGKLPSPREPDCLTAVARDGEGRAQAYLHMVPCYGEQPGYSLDQMRHRQDTPNGLTEWMISTTALELGRRGVSRLSLNFAFLSKLFGKETRLTLPQRLEAAIARRLNPFFQIESLRTFNAKFFPRWEPRYIYYEAPLSLPRVALAYLEAEAFLRLPLIGARRGRKR